ncbi:HNH endonuclease [Streptomyces sp. ID05-26A]|nr:HNH endonuclease [Streptomyces sp. ID05-26A]
MTQLRSPGQIAQPLWVTHEPLPALDADVDEGAAEGSVLRRLRLVRERDPALRKQKIDAVLAASGELACEVCRFDFESFYGERGKGFAEVHHAVPLHVTGPTSTRLTDLVVLCSNCHRMIHRGKDWLTPAQLVQAVETQTSNAHRT